MAVILSRNFRIQDLNIDEVLKVETLTKPFTFAEIYLMKRALERWRIFVRSRHLLKQYFNKWKTFQQMSSKEENESTSQKIDTLISELHRMKVKRKKDVRSNSDSAVEVKKIKGNGATEMKKQWKGECFKNRYKTQRDIIITQKTKLDQQSKIIEDLKLGIINDELTKSLETTKTELQKIFGKSPNKLKCKLAPSGIKFEDTLAKFIINSSKAPKFLQQMERRALERARNREIIRERKRLIDEEKRRIFEEAVEQKRRQDEEEKRKNLEAVREKQREELEKQKIIQANKEKFLADLKKANRFYKRKIMRRCFHRLEHNVYIAQNNMLRAESFSEKKSKINSFNSWKNFIIQKYKGPNEKADKLYKKLTLMKSFGCWKNFHKHCVQNLQVAEDFYDMKLLTNTFIYWHRYVCVQYVLEQKNLLRANFHYKNRILVQYFYLWKSLPAIVQLERAKEEKKKKWREKVKEIIPDYSPPTHD